MSRFSHAHVMGLIGVCLDSSSALLIVMPFMDNGSLLKYLKKERENLIVSKENDEQEVAIHTIWNSTEHESSCLCILHRYKMFASV